MSDRETPIKYRGPQLSTRYYIPNVVEFEGIGPCFWEGLGWCSVSAGDWYMSGAIPAAYKAKAPIKGTWCIVRPTYHAKRETVWSKDYQKGRVE